MLFFKNRVYKKNKENLILKPIHSSSYSDKQKNSFIRLCGIFFLKYRLILQILTIIRKQYNGQNV